MEHLLGTRHYAKGWRRESHGQSDLMPCMTEENKDDRGACGFPRRSLLIREGGRLGPDGECGEQHSRPREALAELGGVAGPPHLGEGNATCARSVFSGVGLGELSCVLGSGLWT